MEVINAADAMVTAREQRIPLPPFHLELASKVQALRRWV